MKSVTSVELEKSVENFKTQKIQKLHTRIVGARSAQATLTTQGNFKPAVQLSLIHI